MRNRNAFTLIEVLASITIMSVFTVIALSSMGNVVNDAKFNQTFREMEIIRNALVGETQRLETGLRKNYGYLGDVGQLPTDVQGIAALSSIPASTSSWSFHASYGFATGWKGPYLTNTSDQDFMKDAWGNNYVYARSGTGATITSYGSDGIAGTTTGDSYSQDIVLTIPSSVTTGTLLGYVVKASGDILGADQVPFTGSAEVYLYYPDGSGGITSSMQAVSAGTSGRYTFSNIPLGFASLKIFIPTSASPSETLGPSLVEINKAATAAVPVAQDNSDIYGSSAMCATNSDFSIVPGSYSKDAAARTLRFDLSFPADFVWSGTFRHEEEKGTPLEYFTVSNAGGTTSFMSSGGSVQSYTGVGVWTGISTNTDTTMSSTTLSTGTLHRFTFKYSTGWDSNDGVFYYQIGCKFIRMHPGI